MADRVAIFSDKLAAISHIESTDVARPRDRESKELRRRYKKVASSNVHFESADYPTEVYIQASSVLFHRLRKRSSTGRTKPNSIRIIKRTTITPQAKTPGVSYILIAIFIL